MGIPSLQHDLNLWFMADIPFLRENQHSLLHQHHQSQLLGLWGCEWDWALELLGRRGSLLIPTVGAGTGAMPGQWGWKKQFDMWRLTEPSFRVKDHQWLQIQLRHKEPLAICTQIRQELNCTTVPMGGSVWILGSPGLVSVLHWWRTGREGLHSGDVGSGLQNTNKNTCRVSLSEIWRMKVICSTLCTNS